MIHRRKLYFILPYTHNNTHGLPSPEDTNSIGKKKNRRELWRLSNWQAKRRSSPPPLVNVFVFFLASFSFSASPPPLNSLFGCSSSHFPSLSRACVLLLRPKGQKRVSTFQFDFRWFESFRRGEFERFPWEIWVSSRVICVFSLERFVQGCRLRSIYWVVKLFLYSVKASNFDFSVVASSIVCHPDNLIFI